MTIKRLGLSYVDADGRRAEQDRDTVAAIQDLQGIELEVTSPGVADKEFSLEHNLRSHTPRAVEVLRSSKGSVVYASRLSEWNERRVFVKATKADDLLLLRVR